MKHALLPNQRTLAEATRNWDCTGFPWDQKVDQLLKDGTLCFHLVKAEGELDLPLKP